jgi:hypothetical protein
VSDNGDFCRGEGKGEEGGCGGSSGRSRHGYVCIGVSGRGERRERGRGVGLVRGGCAYDGRGVLVERVPVRPVVRGAEGGTRGREIGVLRKVFVGLEEVWLLVEITQRERGVLRRGVRVRRGSGVR